MLSLATPVGPDESLASPNGCPGEAGQICQQVETATDRMAEPWPRSSCFLLHEPLAAPCGVRVRLELRPIAALWVHPSAPALLTREGGAGLPDRAGLWSSDLRFRGSATTGASAPLDSPIQPSAQAPGPAAAARSCQSLTWGRRRHSPCSLVRS